MKLSLAESECTVMTKKQNENGEDQMIYTCEHCRYTFSAPVPPLRCPNCGKQVIDRNGFHEPSVRPATDDEIEWYRQIRREIEEEDNVEKGNEE